MTEKKEKKNRTSSGARMGWHQSVQLKREKDGTDYLGSFKLCHFEVSKRACRTVVPLKQVGGEKILTGHNPSRDKTSDKQDWSRGEEKCTHHLRHRFKRYKTAITPFFFFPHNSDLNSKDLKKFR